MKEIVHRLNYFVAAFIGILGISLVSEVIQEDDFVDKIDDSLLFLIGIAGIIWYKRTGYKTNSSLVSVVLMLAALFTKIGAIIVEHADNEAVGDDIGVVSALAVATIFVLWQVYKTRSIK